MRIIALLSVVLSAVLVMPGPAVAAGVTTAQVPATCDGFILQGSAHAAKGGGKVHGFTTYKYSSSCDDQITYFEGSDASWTANLTSLRGKVLDVAADDTGTYLLYRNNTPQQRDTDSPPTAELAVVHRSNDGTYSDPHWLADDTDLPSAGATHGSIVASSGRWYAIWTQVSPATGQHVLYQAETMWGGGAPEALTPPAPTTPVSEDTQPALTLDANGQLKLFWQRAVPDGRDLLLAKNTYGAWNPATRVAAAVNIAPDHPRLDVVATHARIFTSWTATSDSGGENVVVGSSSNDGASFSLSSPPVDHLAYFSSYDAHLQASSSSLFAAFGAADAPPGRAVLGVKLGSKPWHVSEPWQASVPSSIDSFGIVDLIYNGRGRTTTLIYSGENLYAVSTA